MRHSGQRLERKIITLSVKAILSWTEADLMSTEAVYQNRIADLSDLAGVLSIVGLELSSKISRSHRVYTISQTASWSA
jgi:hypothetical protein